MTRSLAISASQITAICKCVAKAGFIAEVVINGTVVRLVPEDRAQSASVSSEDDWVDVDSPSARGTSQPPYPNALSEHYKKLRFDPRTMNGEDYTRLYGEAEAHWRASIPGTPLQKREREALRQLYAYGPNVPVLGSKIKNCGPDTTERLEARGYVDTVAHPKYPESVETFILTEAGYEASRALNL